MSHDRAARLPPTLPCIPVFEIVFVIWKLEPDPTSHSSRGSLTLAQSIKVSEIALTVRPCAMRGECTGSRNLEHLSQITFRCLSPSFQMSLSAIQIISTFFQTVACPNHR